MPRAESDDNALELLAAARLDAQDAQKKAAFWRNAWIGTALVGLLVTLFVGRDA